MNISHIQFLTIANEKRSEIKDVHQTENGQIIVDVCDGIQMIYDDKKELAIISFIDDQMKYAIDNSNHLRLLYKCNESENKNTAISIMKSFVMESWKLKEV